MSAFTAGLAELRKTGRGWNFKAPDIIGLEDTNSQEVTVNNNDKGGDWARFRVAIVLVNCNGSFSPYGIDRRG